jgi:hypothetical protein
VLTIGYYLNVRAGSLLRPIVRPVADHSHMAPRLITHLKENRYASMPDWLGRRNGTFYRTTCVANFEEKPVIVQRLNNHGFTF